jgi:Flp pilus assembly protein TadG
MLKFLKGDERGAAAIEFAMIAPVAILMYCGFAELTIAMMANRRAAHAASVMADLVAQSTSVSSADINDIFNVSNAIMNPFPATPMKVRITSVVADASGVPRVSWSRGNGMTPFGTGAAVSGFPPTLLAAGESVIQADVSYAFTSPLRMTLPNVLNFADTFYLKPRQSTSVAFTG